MMAGSDEEYKELARKIELIKGVKSELVELELDQSGSVMEVRGLDLLKSVFFLNGPCFTARFI